MIGLIISGHGHFATGLESSLTLIGGKPTHFYALDFIEGATTETLEAAMVDAIEDLNQTCDGIIFATDLAGGSPFKSACIVASNYENIEVLAGANLPLLIELNMMRQFESDVVGLADQVVNTGKEQILRFVYEAPTQDDFDSEDGI